jgi:hypothetical protein
MYQSLVNSFNVLVKQEEQYFEEMLKKVDSEIEYELDLYLTKNAGAEENSKLNEQVRKEIQSKFDKKRLFILASL